MLELSAKPISHPDCCLSLSTPLVTTLAGYLPEFPDLVLSIGSGSGLLERLLTARHPQLRIQGVEIQDVEGINKHLPEEDVFTVVGSIGSGVTCERASVATAWMFVYPRTPLLVRNYVQRYGGDCVDIIIWLGPKSDWEDFAPAFQSAAFENPQEIMDCGLPAYETMVIVQKKLR